MYHLPYPSAFVYFYEGCCRLTQWRSQDLVSAGAQPISPFFHSLSPLFSVLYHPPISLFILPARPPFPIALSYHKCSGRSGGTVSSPAGPGGTQPPNSFWCISLSIQSLLIASLWVVIVLITVKFVTFLVIAMDGFYSKKILMGFRWGPGPPVPPPLPVGCATGYIQLFLCTLPLENIITRLAS